MMRSKFWEHKGSVKSRKFTQPRESLFARLFCFASLRLELVAAAEGKLGDRGQRRNAEPRRPRRRRAAALPVVMPRRPSPATAGSAGRTLQRPVNHV